MLLAIIINLHFEMAINFCESIKYSDFQSEMECVTEISGCLDNGDEMNECVLNYGQ